MSSQAQFDGLVRDFSAGYLDTPESDSVPLGAVVFGENAEFESTSILNGVPSAKLAKRRGCRLLTVTSLDLGKKVDGIFEFRRPGFDALLCAVVDGQLWRRVDDDAWIAIGSAVFAPGQPVHGRVMLDNLFLTDGFTTRRFDGISLFPVGEAAPTAATDMTTGAGAPGVTGTWEAFYTWYDSTEDVDSSPSPTTAELVTVTGTRIHTKPTGSPASNITHWRAWVRSVSSSEIRFYLAATVSVATSTWSEETTDVLRNVPGPRDDNENDPAPAFLLMAPWKGYGVGVELNAGTFWLSKQGNVHAWHPADVFKVSGEEPVTTAKQYGTEFLLQTPHATWRLIGTQKPFELRDVLGSWGNANQSSSAEVDGRYYGWDRVRGPYVTDLASWMSLADQRIEKLVASANESVLNDIRVVVRERDNLIGWSFATGHERRKRVLIWFNYHINAWLPPWTGPEWASFCEFTEPDREVGTFMGDEWGRVWELFRDDRDGPKNDDVSGSVTSSSSSVVTCSGATFNTDGSGLAGTRMYHLAAATGAWQCRQLISNTGTALTVDTANESVLDPVPVSGDTVVVCGIGWFMRMAVWDFGRPELSQKVHLVHVQARAQGPTHVLETLLRVNDEDTIEQTYNFVFPTKLSALVFGTGVYGTGLHADAKRATRKLTINMSPYTIQPEFRNFYADQPMTLVGYGFTADALPRARVPGGEA